MPQPGAVITTSIAAGTGATQVTLPQANVAVAYDESADMFGAPEHTVTVRAETSRLRRIVGGLLLHRPYRFADWVDVRVRYPAAPEDILPASTAPAVRHIRACRTVTASAQPSS